MSTHHAHHAPATLDEVVGERIFQLLWRRKISQTAFAPTIGVTQSGLSKKLRGERGWSLDEVARASSALGTTFAYLLGHTDDPAPANDEKAPTREGGGHVLPEVDSNHQPAGFKPRDHPAVLIHRLDATITPIRHARRPRRHHRLALVTALPSATA